MGYSEYKLPDHFQDMGSVGRSIYTSIYTQRFRDMNWFGTTIGMPGAGKTTFFLKMLYELQVDPITLERNFDPETQIVFSIKDFLKLVQNTDPVKNPGFGILYDEIELDAHARGWGAISKQLELTVSTMRFKRNILCASLPHEKQLLKGVRRLRNARIFCKFVNHKQRFVYAKYYNLDYNMTADTYKNETTEAKQYFPRVKLNTEHGIRPFRINGVKAYSPPKKIVKVYKKMKADFLDSYYAQQIAYWDKEDSKNSTNDVSFSRACEFIDKYKDDLMFKGKVDPVILAEELSISTSRAKEFARAYTHKKEIKKLKRISYID